MRVGIVGLGKMGSGIARRLVRAGYPLWGYDPGLTSFLHGVTRAHSLMTLVAECEVVILSIPAHSVDAVLNLIAQSATELESAPLGYIIDAGNSFYRDSQRRSAQCASVELSFLDAGVSGGIHGATNGYSIMVGGEQESFDELKSIFEACASEQGLVYCGPVGAGHYVKTIHNGIEYALMQAYAEGLAVLEHSPEVTAPLSDITRCWQNGSIIRSWILELMQRVVSDREALERTVGRIDENGTGRWALEAASDRNLSFKQLEQALEARRQSREEEVDLFSAKVLAQLRHAFGGHPVSYHGSPDKQRHTERDTEIV